MPTVTGLKGSSATKSLEVLGAGGLVGILDFRVPSKLQQGEIVGSVAVDVKNFDWDSHDVFVRIYDVDTGGVVGTSITQLMEPARVLTFSVTLGAMPNKDWKLRAKVSHEYMEEPTGVDKTIQLWILIVTTLTLSLSPTRVSPGANFTMSGKLSRADAVAPGIRSIALKINGTVLGTATTDVNGNYSLTKPAPSPVLNVTYTVRAEFAQVDILGYSFAERGLFVGAVRPSWKQALGLGALGGITLAAVLYRKG